MGSESYSGQGISTSRRSVDVFAAAVERGKNLDRDATVAALLEEFGEADE